jgi:type VI secretion system VasD/TssJ family lipoprotein
MVSAFLAYSCAPKPLAPVEWKYEESAIKLYVNADPQVNLYDNMAHALHVCVYQLRDPNAFNQLAETPEGISELLQCQLFDTGVANSKVLSRLGIQPGKVLTFTLDRAEGAKYLSVVAGYQVLEKDRTARLFKIPVVIEKVRKGFFRTEKIQKPGLLEVELYLGPQQIQRAIIVKEEKD